MLAEEFLKCSYFANQYDEPDVTMDYFHFTDDGYAPVYKDGILYYVTRNSEEIFSWAFSCTDIVKNVKKLRVFVENMLK